MHRQYLKSLRQERGLSMKEVAEGLGIRESFYYLIETGEGLYKMPIGFARRIAPILGVSAELIYEKEKQRRLAMREEERRKIMGEKTCPRCGASLDPCEKCDCVGAVVVPEIVDRTEELEKLVSKNIKGE